MIQKILNLFRKEKKVDLMYWHNRLTELASFKNEKYVQVKCEIGGHHGVGKVVFIFYVNGYGLTKEYSTPEECYKEMDKKMFEVELPKLNINPIV